MENKGSQEILEGKKQFIFFSKSRIEIKVTDKREWYLWIKETNIFLKPLFN